MWSILEIFEQKERVETGWFPMNPKRKSEYRPKEFGSMPLPPLCVTEHSSEEKIHTEISNQDTEKRHDTVEQEEPRIAETLDG